MVPPEDSQVRAQCSGCRHFVVTYDPAQPYGCRAFGFQSKVWPGRLVWQESGALCTLREDSQPDSSKASKDRARR